MCRRSAKETGILRRIVKDAKKQLIICKKVGRRTQVEKNIDIFAYLHYNTQGMLVISTFTIAYERDSV